MRRSKELRKAILQHGAYHNQNIDKICHSQQADTFYTDEEKIFLEASLLRDHFKVMKMKEKELKLWFFDKTFMEFLKQENKKLYNKVMRLFKEYGFN